MDHPGLATAWALPTGQPPAQSYRQVDLQRTASEAGRGSRTATGLKQVQPCLNHEVLLPSRGTSTTNRKDQFPGPLVGKLLPGCALQGDAAPSGSGPVSGKQLPALQCLLSLHPMGPLRAPAPPMSTGAAWKTMKGTPLSSPHPTAPDTHCPWRGGPGPQPHLSTHKATTQTPGLVPTAACPGDALDIPTTAPASDPDHSAALTSFQAQTQAWEVSWGQRCWEWSSQDHQDPFPSVRAA